MKYHNLLYIIQLYIYNKKFYQKILILSFIYSLLYIYYIITRFIIFNILTVKKMYMPLAKREGRAEGLVKR